MAFEIIELPTPLHCPPGLVPTLGSVLGACSVQAPLAKTQLSLHSVVTLHDIKVEFPSSQGSSVKVSH